MVNSFPQVLTIAGSDSDGSAGAQADLHSFFARKVYGMSILVAAVSGNSYGITNQHLFPKDIIDDQFKVLAEDFEISSVKTGMLGNEEVIKTVIDNLNKYDFGYLVVDPVITTKHGAQLLSDDAVVLMKKELLRKAFVATPNFYEAQILADMGIKSPEDKLLAAKKIQELGVKNVVIKGEHIAPIVSDLVLFEDGSFEYLDEPFINTKHINGTGDTFSSIIVAELAKGNSVLDAIKTAKKLTFLAIEKGIDVGHEFGPINHWELLD